MPLDAIAFVIFIAAVALYIYKDRKKFEFQGVILMRKTERGKKFLDQTVDDHSKFWNYFSLAAIAIGIPAMIFISFFIVNNAFNVATGSGEANVRIVLPSAGFGTLPGVLLVPWYFWIIGIAIVVIPHELCHGIMCRLEKIRVSYLGWFLLLFIPGAFVEPDKVDMKKASRLSRLKVYAAGSMANIVLGVIFLAITLLILSTLFTSGGIVPKGIIKDSPAELVNLSGAIVSINGIAINSQSDLIKILNKTPVGSDISVETNEYAPSFAGLFCDKTKVKNYTITTSKNPDTNISYLGVQSPYYACNMPKSKQTGLFASFLAELFSWLFVISIGIGLFNLLPLKPLDGGLVYEEIVGRFVNKEKAIKAIVIGTSLIMVFLVVFNIFGPFVIK